MSKYEAITQKLIEAIESADPSGWVRPWKTMRSFNASTGRRYSGVNVILLAVAAMDRGFASSGWLTFKQAKAMGGHVRRGEKGTQICLFKPIVVRDEKTDEEKTVPVLRVFTVFNVEQCEGIEFTPEVETSEFIAVDEAEAFIAAVPATVSFGHGLAAYNIAGDYVMMPSREQFVSSASFYSTLFHELGHWTGSKERLNRTFGKRFGDDAYAFEELVAELTATFLDAEFGIEGDLRHPEYLANWLRVLKSDSRAIFTAAREAQRAADYLIDAATCSDINEAEQAA